MSRLPVRTGVLADSRRPVRSRRPAGLRGVLLAILLFTSVAAAQGGDMAGAPVWVQTIDGSPAGKPAEVVFLPNDSNDQETWFEVYVYGYWREDVVEAGTTYQRIRVPGLQSMGNVGGPELPSVRVQVAVPTDADQVSFLGVDEWVVQTYPSLHVYPTPLPGNDELFDPSEDPGDGDTVGTEEIFSIDTAIYSGSGAYPPDPIAPDPLTNTFYGALNGASLEVFPMSWDPATDELRVMAHGQYAFSHQGGVQSPIKISKHKDTLAAMTFVNWTAVKDTGWSVSYLDTHSRYAIVANAMFDAALVPFINHKKTLGFQVSVIPHAPGASWASILSDVRDWYLAGDPAEDHYVLLVGDTVNVPYGFYVKPGTGTLIPTDDYFGSPVDGDLDKEVYVGRLSVDSPADLSNQIQKIIDYEINPIPGGRYDRALLVAHKEGAPGKYEGAHEDVRTASYATPPVFQTEYGSGGSATNAQVSSKINAGVGVVAYRGHGSSNAWTLWDSMSESYHKNQVIGLSNNVHPVVWAITCTNGDIGGNGGGPIDCIAETWMEMPTTAAVASYGATVVTGTNPNHELDRRLFEAVYDAGIIVHGQAIAYAEQHVDSIWPGHTNTWAYLLLGDPSMLIRREVPKLLSVTVPGSVAQCDDQGCGQAIDITAMANGEAIDGALVSLWKPSLDPSQPDEVLTNLYTDAFGDATLPVSLLTPGPMYWSVQDDQGNATTGQIAVEMSSAWTTLGTGVPGVNGPLSLVGIGSLQGGTYVTSILTNARANSSAALVVGFNAISAPFKGGIWVPSIDLLVPGISTGPDGVINLPATWPMNVPSGFQFYEQYWMADPAAPQGYASSNAIVGTTP